MILDKTDFKILYSIHYNARAPLTELASKVGLSKQNLNYRLKKLIQEGIIAGFMSVIDIHHLGYLTYRVYLRFRSVDEKKEQEIRQYFQQHDHVLWCVSISGSWDLEVVFTAHNYIHFNNLFKKIREDLGMHFSKYNISSSIVNYHFPKDYLINKQREQFTPTYYGFEPKAEQLDRLDFNILTELSQDCRQNNQQVAKKLGVTYHTVKNRIQTMDKKKIIQSHRILINLAKIGRKHYKANLVLHNPTKEEEKKLYAFCSQFNVVTYLIEVLGDWQFEVEAEVQNQEEFTELLRKIRNEFPNLILDYEILQVTKEHKLNYFPMGHEILERAS